MTNNEFISEVVNELLDNKFSVVLHQKKELSEIGGSFNGSDKEFIASIRGQLGFEIFIHEYCHFLQWKHNRKYYDRLVVGCSIIFDWLDGNFYKKSILKYGFDCVIELERDCEIRAIEIIKKYNLNVDIENYTRTANSYLLFYNIIRENRKWSKGEIYKKGLINTMPNTIMDLDYYLNSDNITDKQRKKYLKGLE